MTNDSQLSLVPQSDDMVHGEQRVNEHIAALSALIPNDAKESIEPLINAMLTTSYQTQGLAYVEELVSDIKLLKQYAEAGQLEMIRELAHKYNIPDAFLSMLADTLTLPVSAEPVTDDGPVSTEVSSGSDPVVPDLEGHETDEFNNEPD